MFNINKLLWINKWLGVSIVNKEDIFMIWVVNTNSNMCHIYDYQKNPAQLILLKELNHPENRLKKSDFLTSDKPGHYQSDPSHAGGSFSQRTDPKEVAIDDFAREIARELNHGRTTNAYESLVLITPPHMNGLLLQHLDKHVKERVAHTIQKDLQHLTDKELLALLKTNTKFSG